MRREGVGSGQMPAAAAESLYVIHLEKYIFTLYDFHVNVQSLSSSKMTFQPTRHQRRLSNFV